MYRMTFLKGVHVTEAGPDRILARIIKTLEDNPETYKRDSVIHTNTETVIRCEVVRKKDAENREMQIHDKGVEREKSILFLFCPPTPTWHTVVLLVSFWSSVGWFTPK